MAAHKCNQYWQFRNKHGRNYKYNPDGLWNEAIEYFNWVEENPLIETKLFAYKGSITEGEIPKMRAMTIAGFCLFADITQQTFLNYKQNKDFFEVITRIEDIIKTQKFEGAAADLLNSNIIAYDLGMNKNNDKEQENKPTIVVKDGGIITLQNE